MEGGGAAGEDGGSGADGAGSGSDGRAGDKGAGDVGSGTGDAGAGDGAGNGTGKVRAGCFAQLVAEKCMEQFRVFGAWNASGKCRVVEGSEARSLSLSSTPYAHTL